MIGHSFMDQVTVIYFEDGNTKINIVLENSISVPARESFLDRKWNWRNHDLWTYIGLVSMCQAAYLLRTVEDVLAQDCSPVALFLALIRSRP